MIFAKKYTILKTTLLILSTWLNVLRFDMEDVNKLLSFWNSKSFLVSSNRLISDPIIEITKNQWLLNNTDFHNTWGQILTSLCLVLGILTKLAGFTISLLLFLYDKLTSLFIDSLSFIGKNLIELLNFIILLIFPKSQIVGLALFLSLSEVKNFEKK